MTQMMQLDTNFANWQIENTIEEVLEMTKGEEPHTKKIVMINLENSKLRDQILQNNNESYIKMANLRFQMSKICEQFKDIVAKHGLNETIQFPEDIDIVKENQMLIEEVRVLKESSAQEKLSQDNQVSQLKMEI